jgi:hypothetical protein
MENREQLFTDFWIAVYLSSGRHVLFVSHATARSKNILERLDTSIGGQIIPNLTSRENAKISFHVTSE